MSVRFAKTISARQSCALLFVSLAALFVSGCRQKMDKQPKYLPLEKSNFFADGRASRPLVQDTVARGHLESGNPLYTGLKRPLESSPSAVAGSSPVATTSAAGASTPLKTVNP